jgi:hypothetical protein
MRRGQHRKSIESDIPTNLMDFRIFDFKPTGDPEHDARMKKK